MLVQINPCRFQSSEGPRHFPLQRWPLPSPPRCHHWSLALTMRAVSWHWQLQRSHTGSGGLLALKLFGLERWILFLSSHWLTISEKACSTLAPAWIRRGGRFPTWNWYRQEQNREYYPFLMGNEVSVLESPGAFTPSFHFNIRVGAAARARLCL